MRDFINLAACLLVGLSEEKQRKTAELIFILSLKGRDTNQIPLKKKSI